ncbi:MAG: hypothetical protein H0X45_13790 [Planctomycetes bacterium]|nr:hypothetical protein [Planctomycetota bacterium]
MRKLCIQNRCDNHASVTIEFDGKPYRRENCPRAVNLITDFDEAQTGVRVPLSARFHVTVQPRKDATEEAPFRFTQLKVRREVPDTPDDKVLYFIIEPELNVRLTVLTVAQLDEMEKRGTFPP